MIIIDYLMYPIKSWDCPTTLPFSHHFPIAFLSHEATIIFFFHPVIYMKFTLPAMALWGIPHGYRELQIFHDGYNRGTSTTTKSLR